MSFVLVASLLLTARFCLIGADHGVSDNSTIDVALKPLYSQLETFKSQLDAFKLLFKCQCNNDCRVTCPEGSPLGMEDGSIPDERITASSSYSPEHHAPSRARLNIQGYASGWSANADDVSPWIQVDFTTRIAITGLITQGRADSNDQWVTEYRVKYSVDGSSWNFVKDQNGMTKEFTGNADKDTHVTTTFATPLHTRFLRIMPTNWHTFCSMRFEVLGCR